MHKLHSDVINEKGALTDVVKASALSEGAHIERE